MRYGAFRTRIRAAKWGFWNVICTFCHVLGYGTICESNVCLRRDVDAGRRTLTIRNWVPAKTGIAKRSRLQY
jgi:hypothetical protein